MSKSTQKTKLKSNKNPKIQIKSKDKKSKKEKSKKEKTKITTNKDLELELNQEEYDDTNNDIIHQNDYREIIKTYNPNNNKTSSLLTVYEATLIVGKRATQISLGAEPLIKYEITETPENIAIRELLNKKTPFIIKRRINNITEYWKIEDMELDEEAISIFD